MKILAIDPGTTESAYVVWDAMRGEIIDKGKVSNEDLYNKSTGLSMCCAVIAFEMMASYGMPVGKEVFETVLFTGRLIERVNCNAIRALVYRQQVKLHHCHSPKANDATIRQALIDRLGAPGTKNKPGPTYGVTKDVWSALAIAVFAGDVFLKKTEATLKKLEY